MNIYLTDGTEAGFYTAVLAACNEPQSRIVSHKTVQLSFDSALLPVETDITEAERVKNKLRRFDKHAEEEISLILRRGDDGREQIALEYIRLIARYRAPVRARLSEPAVLNARDAVKKVRGETHRFTGFLRFMEGKNGIYYAPFEPDNDILELLVPHFTERLKKQPFIIHDTKRKKAALYNTRECVLTRTDDKVSVNLSDCEQAFQSLWKEYYRAVNIAERPHPKQMKGYMPVQYWKYMPEKGQDPTKGR